MSEETIFETARSKTAPAERAAYLDAACAGDPELRRRIEDLLRAHERSGGLLDSLPHDPSPRTEQWGDTPLGGGPPSARPITEGPGSTIGPYNLIRKIGEGGMGAVFLAESIPGLMTFSATVRRTGRSCAARKTTPMPPSPTFRVRW